MRRREKEVKDPAVIEKVLRAGEWGVLALVSPDGLPVMVPLNYADLDGRLYFHGSHHGEKMEIIGQGCPASFLVVEAYSVIPSYAFDAERACKATQYFTSVLAYGRVAPVEHPEIKAKAIQALMEKLQPEGGFRPVTAEDPMYETAVRDVAILEFVVERTAAKREVGARLTPESRLSVEDLLKRRGRPEDLRTLQEMA